MCRRGRCCGALWGPSIYDIKLLLSYLLDLSIKPLVTVTCIRLNFICSFWIWRTLKAKHFEQKTSLKTNKYALKALKAYEGLLHWSICQYEESDHILLLKSFVFFNKWSQSLLQINVYTSVFLIFMHNATTLLVSILMIKREFFPLWEKLMFYHIMLICIFSKF